MKKYIYITLVALTASLVFGFNEINDSSNKVDLNDLKTTDKAISKPGIENGK